MEWHGLIASIFHLFFLNDTQMVMCCANDGRVRCKEMLPWLTFAGCWLHIRHCSQRSSWLNPQRKPPWPILFLSLFYKWWSQAGEDKELSFAAHQAWTCQSWDFNPAHLSSDPSINHCFDQNHSTLGFSQEFVVFMAFSTSLKHCTGSTGQQGIRCSCK